jgi:GDP-L-fucose synthase
MPTNLYGPNDNFDLRTSHVLPALIRKVQVAKTSGAESVMLWGTGKPRREFLHVDDLADALVYLMRFYEEEEHINVGFGSDVTIGELARHIAEVVGFAGRFEYDITKPDGAPRKLLDITRLKSIGWEARVPLAEGIRSTYAWFLEHAWREERSSGAP